MGSPSPTLTLMLTSNEVAGRAQVLCVGANAVALNATRQATRAERRKENLAIVEIFFLDIVCASNGCCGIPAISKEQVMGAC